MAQCAHCQATIPDAATTCVFCGETVVPNADDDLSVVVKHVATSTAPPMRYYSTPSEPDSAPVETDSLSGFDRELKDTYIPAAPPMAYYPTPSEPLAEPLRLEPKPSAAPVEGWSTLTSLTPNEALGSKPELPDSMIGRVEEAGPPTMMELIEPVGEAEMTDEVEIELLPLVGVYTIIGAYSGAVVGLFVPVFIVLGLIFGLADGFTDVILGFIILGGLGAILWVPASIVLAIIAGIGSLLLGLGVGIVAAFLFKLVYKNPQTLQTVRVLVAILNAAIFGYAAYWTYTNSFLIDMFPEVTFMPPLLGFLGALSGLVMGLFGPEKVTENTEPLSDEDNEAVMSLFAAPFRLWRGIARPSMGVSVGAMEAVGKSLEAQYDPNNPEYQRREIERLTKEQANLLEKQRKQQEEWRKLLK